MNATEDELFDAIWTGEANGFGEAHCTAMLAETRRDLSGLNAGTITPRRIVGAGVRNPKTTARRWLLGQIDQWEQGLATKGRSVLVNQRNVAYAQRQQAAPVRPDWLTFAAPVDVLVTHPALSWRPGQVLDAHPVDGAPDVWRARVAVLGDTGRVHVARTYTAHRSCHVDSLVRPAPSDRAPMLDAATLRAI